MDYTVLMLAFAASCSFGGYLAARIYRRDEHNNNASKNLKCKNLNILSKNLKKVKQEREIMIKELTEICSLISELSKQSSFSSLSSSQNSFFKQEIKAPQLTPDDIEVDDLFSQSKNILNSYPDFSEKQEEQDSDYFVRINQHFTEHHIITMELSGKLLKRLTEIKGALLKAAPSH